MPTQPQQRMREYLQLVATGPALSKSLDAAQAEDAMSLILEQQVDAVSAGILLIALRMKRESDAENSGVLNALTKVMHSASTRSQQVIVIADPFNGYLRCLPATAFLPAVFAACGLPACIHGMALVAPKYGMTANMVLRAAGKNVDLSVNDAVAQIDNHKCGWAYVDQKQYIPKLHALVKLRDTMVKRTCLSTLEVVLKPIAGAGATHLLTGFVHKAYPSIYAKLAMQAGFESAMLVRGVEGGCIPSLNQLSRYFAVHDDAEGDAEITLHRLLPADLGIAQQQRMVAIPEALQNCTTRTSFNTTNALLPLITHTVALGKAALNNQPGAMLDSLIYGAAIGLTAAGMVKDLAAAADIARNAIATGAALHRFENG